MQWVKVKVLGKERSQIAFHCCQIVKTEEHTLKKEKRILDHLYGSPHIQTFLADTVSFSEQLTGWVYDLLLEYAPGGTLSDLIKNRGGRLPECEVREYTRMILKGLCGVYQKGYVHCDLKPDNTCPSFTRWD
ncbi:hypothetical protein LWI29_012411 [Acer saccharum]|uniref:Protein kinase domain-containing protein n=1 Tax=Acer saccharum TaxID=4024 RepID=A0AA39RVV0_ACESA|nr:hypothetical protein LWI29_012411 [Acer saccharum]KAK1559015.1 hypothetical protein Q3G72_009467 [Acer saccharum]